MPSSPSLQACRNTVSPSLSRPQLQLLPMRASASGALERRDSYQHRPVTAAQSKTRRRTPQGDAELMTEKQVRASSSEGSTRTEQHDDAGTGSENMTQKCGPRSVRDLVVHRTAGVAVGECRNPCSAPPASSSPRPAAGGRIRANAGCAPRPVRSRGRCARTQESR